MTRTRPEGPPAVRIEAENEWAWCGARRLSLTPRAFAVLRHLVEHPGRLITKEELLTAVWRDAIVSDAALSSCIRDLRKALGDSSGAPRYIQTVHRRGFRFIGLVAQPTGAVAAAGSTAPAGRADIQSPAGFTSSSHAVPTLVGREAELARLHTRLVAALSGQRQLVFVTGEPGIGKTALVEVFLAEVGEANALRIGWGQCVEQYGAGEAYLPVLEALGRLGRAAGGEQLVQILKQHAPTWLEQLPGLLSDRDVEVVQRRAQGATRDRMLRELVEALDALTREAPLVLLLEDLHWSDSATIDLLRMLARRREASRLLVLGTYRPADVASATAHPLKWVKDELQLHGHCDEIPLEFLSTAAVGQYLSRRFPGHGLPLELALVLHRNTDGNPLFLVNTIDDLIGQGQLREVDGQWRLSGPAEDIASRAPETLWQLVEKQVERLTADEQAVLVAVSVAGVEFSAAVAVAAGIDPQQGELQCEALARRGQFLRRVGSAEWPDGTVAGRYAFIHALYQQVLYGRVSIGERVGLHLRTAERLERGYGERASEIAGELAVHFEHGRDLERAARYRRQAGEHALHQHAYGEAADHATRALDSLRTLPDSRERAQQTLALQVTLGTALTATQGYAAPEVARTYARAWELCAQMGETPQLLPVLLGIGRFYVVRGEFKTARDVGTYLLTMAEATRDPTLLLAAHNALGIVSLYSGEFETALDHLERGIERNDSDEPDPSRPRAFRLVPPVVTCAIHAAWTLWILGYPDRAAARAREALALARSLDHPFGLSYACHLAAALHQWRKDLRTVQELEDEALAYDTEHGFGLLLTVGVVQRGWLLAERGQNEKALDQMQEGVAMHREIGAEVLVPAFLALVAEVHQKLGRPAEGLSALTEALTVAQQSGQHYWEAELHRLMGVLTLQSEAGPGRDAGSRGAGYDQPDPVGRRSAGIGPASGDAESHFLRAIEIARRQRARSLELRAATSLSRLWADRGNVREAHALLSGIYAWFTEGFDTADLSEAKSLLEELESRAGG
jgi:DNA-binding winged helix-turn-helix (wHTH) protein/predicted ATPase